MKYAGPYYCDWYYAEESRARTHNNLPFRRISYNRNARHEMKVFLSTYDVIPIYPDTPEYNKISEISDDVIALMILQFGNNVMFDDL